MFFRMQGRKLQVQFYKEGAMKNSTKLFLFLIAVIILIAAILIIKNQQGPAVTETGAQTVQQAATVVPQKAWTLRDSAMANMTSFDPVKIVDAFSVNVLSNVYEGLVNVSPEGKPVPGLAESWEHSQDGKVWTFYLRKGVKFHPVTGVDFKTPEEMTARDVVYSFKRAIAAPGAVTSWIFLDILEGASEFAKGETKEISGLEIIDPYTLKVRLKKPYYLITRLTFNGTWVYPAGIFEAGGKDFLSSREAGTGPYMLENFVPDDKIVLTRFNAYRQPHTKSPQKVVIRIFSDPLAAMETFAGGGLDIVEASLSTLPRARALAAKGNSLISVKANYLDYICINNKSAPFDDIRVRRALNMAVDRAALARVLTDFGTPAYGFIPPFSAAFRGADLIKKQGFGFDPARAKTLVASYLEEKGKQALELELVIDSGEVPETIGQFVQAQLEENLSHVQVTLKKITWPAMLQMAFGGKGLFYRMWWNIVTPGNDLYFLFYFPGQDPPHGFNLSFYDSGEFPAEYNAVMATLDKEKRIQGVRLLEDMMIRDAAAIPLLHKTYYFLKRKGVTCSVNGLLKKAYINAAISGN